ncbi:MAG: hypothetical protein R2883_05325 [Caldisericia bacterium]
MKRIVYIIVFLIILPSFPVQLTARQNSTKNHAIETIFGYYLRQDGHEGIEVFGLMNKIPMDAQVTKVEDEHLVCWLEKDSYSENAGSLYAETIERMWYYEYNKQNPQCLSENVVKQFCRTFRNGKSDATTYIAYITADKRINLQYKKDSLWRIIDTSSINTENKINLENSPFITFDKNGAPILAWVTNIDNRTQISISRWVGGKWIDFDQNVGFESIGENAKNPEIEVLDTEELILVWEENSSTGNKINIGKRTERGWMGINNADEFSLTESGTNECFSRLRINEKIGKPSLMWRDLENERILFANIDFESHKIFGLNGKNEPTEIKYYKMENSPNWVHSKFGPLFKFEPNENDIRNQESKNHPQRIDFVFENDSERPKMRYFIGEDIYFTDGEKTSILSLNHEYYPQNNYTKADSWKDPNCGDYSIALGGKAVCFYHETQIMFFCDKEKIQVESPDTIEFNHIMMGIRGIYEQAINVVLESNSENFSAELEKKSGIISSGICLKNKITITPRNDYKNEKVNISLKVLNSNNVVLGCKVIEVELTTFAITNIDKKEDTYFEILPPGIESRELRFSFNKEYEHEVTASVVSELPTGITVEFDNAILTPGEVVSEGEWGQAVDIIGYKIKVDSSAKTGLHDIILRFEGFMGDYVDVELELKILDFQFEFLRFYYSGFPLVSIENDETEFQFKFGLLKRENLKSNITLDLDTEGYNVSYSFDLGNVINPETDSKNQPKDKNKR